MPRTTLYRFTFLAALLAIAGCNSTPAPVYRMENFDAEPPYQYHSDLPPLVLCEYGKRALLSQAYEVDATTPSNIRGSKSFQPQTENLVQLRITLTCMATGRDTTIYANALSVYTSQMTISVSIYLCSSFMIELDRLIHISFNANTVFHHFPERIQGHGILLGSCLL